MTFMQCFISFLETDSLWWPITFLVWTRTAQIFIKTLLFLHRNHKANRPSHSPFAYVIISNITFIFNYILDFMIYIYIYIIPQLCVCACVCVWGGGVRVCVYIYIIPQLCVCVRVCVCVFVGGGGLRVCVYIYIIPQLCVCVRVCVGGGGACVCVYIYYRCINRYISFIFIIFTLPYKSLGSVKCIQLF